MLCVLVLFWCDHRCQFLRVSRLLRPERERHHLLVHLLILGQAPPHITRHQLLAGHPPHKHHHVLYQSRAQHILDDTHRKESVSRSRKERGRRQDKQDSDGHTKTRLTHTTSIKMNGITLLALPACSSHLNSSPPLNHCRVHE